MSVLFNMLSRFVIAFLPRSKHLHPLTFVKGASQVALVVKNPPANAGDLRDGVQTLGQEDILEESMVTHSSILAWRIPWTEKPGRLQSTGLQRVRNDRRN